MSNILHVDLNRAHANYVAVLRSEFAARFAGVHSQNLNPNVLMVEPTEDWHRHDAADPL